jgi:hypothetical protein
MFDADTRRGILSFAAVPGVTEIAAPTRLYPGGVDTSVEGVGGRATWNAERGVLLVETTGAGAATISFGPPDAD